MKSCGDRATGKLLAMLFADLKIGSAETRERTGCRAPSNCAFSLPNRFRAAMDSIVEAVLPIVET